MKFLFYFSHPAQYLASRETIRRLSEKKEHEITVLIKTKDVLEELIKKDGIAYTNILPEERGSSKASIIISLLKRIVIILPILLKKKPDLLIGTDATLAQLGAVLNINRITILEDDYAVIKSMANVMYPFTQTILCPQVCDVGNWGSKKIGYKGYMKLGYLHPAVFSVNPSITDKYSITTKYIMIRLSRLAAYHDIGIDGIDGNTLDEIIKILKQKQYRIVISSEGGIPKKYEQYQLPIEAADIHHILANAVMLISDSQSMSVEAAVLGIPSIRYSSLVGKLSVLEELEEKYGLTFGILSGNVKKLLYKLDELLNSENLCKTFQAKRQVMLNDKIDITSFWVWFFENYPESKMEVKKMNEVKDKQGVANKTITN